MLRLDVLHQGVHMPTLFEIFPYINSDTHQRILACRSVQLVLVSGFKLAAQNASVQSDVAFGCCATDNYAEGLRH